MNVFSVDTWLERYPLNLECKDTDKKCYYVMAIPIIFTWKWNLGWSVKRVGRTQAPEIKFLRSVSVLAEYAVLRR